MRWILVLCMLVACADLAAADPVDIPLVAELSLPCGPIVETRLPGRNGPVITLCAACAHDCPSERACHVYGACCERDAIGCVSVCSACCDGEAGALRCRPVERATKTACDKPCDTSADCFWLDECSAKAICEPKPCTSYLDCGPDAATVDTSTDYTQSWLGGTCREGTCRKPCKHHGECARSNCTKLHQGDQWGWCDTY